jgi:hypothetical protein
VLRTEVVGGRMRRMRVVFRILAGEVAVRSVRVSVRVNVRVNVRSQRGARVRMPLRVILERQVQRHQQRLQHEADAQDGAEKPVQRAGSRLAWHGDRDGLGLGAPAVSTPGGMFVEANPAGKGNRVTNPVELRPSSSSRARQGSSRGRGRLGTPAARRQSS